MTSSESSGHTSSMTIRESNDLICSMVEMEMAEHPDHEMITARKEERDEQTEILLVSVRCEYDQAV